MHEQIRASHAEREAVLRRLMRALEEGRITPEEFEERSAAAYDARTHGQLAALTRDLPGHLW